MKKVIVTGGAGFIGRHTLEPLINSGYAVHVLVRPGSQFTHQDVVVHDVDLLDASQHMRLMDEIKPTHLIHTAWYTKNGLFWDAIDNIDWMVTTLSLAEAFYNAGGHRFVGLGTCAEYDWQDGVCVEGKTREVPSTFYGKIKKATYECLGAIAKEHSASFAWARIFFPFGPAEDKVRLIPHVITHLLRGAEAKCTQGDQVRDFLHVRDIGQALVAVLNSDVTGAINIGSGSPVKIKEVVTQLGEMLGRNDLIKLGAIANPPHSPASILAQTDRLNFEVGWRPSMTLQQGLLSTIQWWQEQYNELTEGELIR